MLIVREKLKLKMAKHKSEFLGLATFKHGGKYIYDMEAYKSNHVKMPITCPRHGIFFQKPYSHIQGVGCKKCAIEFVSKERRQDTAYFKMKAKNVHAGKYDYSKSHYVNNRTKIIITCPIHSDFLQDAAAHLQGRGCRKCAIEDHTKRKTDNLDSFLSKSKLVHGDKYGYSKAVYVRGNKKVIITCHKHGDFLQTPTLHMSGSGCKICYIEKARLDKLGSIETFLKSAYEVHKDTYCYSKVQYVSSKAKVIITCRRHGDFLQAAGAHLVGQGCPECGRINARLSTQEFIARSVAIHGERYDYSETVYELGVEPLTIKCRDHGKFVQQANNHMNGAGCPKCAQSKGERAVAVVLKKLNIDFVEQYMVLGNLYRYDFYLPRYNVFIEYHGIQHYMQVDHFHSRGNNRATFQAQLIRDMMKEEIVRVNKGRLLKIKYTFKTLEDIETCIVKWLNINRYL